MKLVTPREAFLQHLQIVAPISPSRTPRPILKDVLIAVTGNEVRLTATDGEISVTTTYEDEGVSGEGQAALPTATTLDAVRSLQDNEVCIDDKGAFHQISGGRAEFKIHGDDPAVYPEIPAVDKEKAITVPLKEFLDLCSKTTFAAAKEMGRYAFNGVLLELDADEVTLVATDGRRLSLARMKCATGATERVSAILPLRGLVQLQRSAGEVDDETPLFIGIEENQVAFGLPKGEIVARLVEGEFPDFRGVLPKAKDAPLEAVIDRSEFENAIRQVAVTAGEEGRSVELCFEEGRLVLRSRHEGVGESESSVPATYSGEAVEIRFNPEFLGDYLKNLSNLNVTFHFRDRSSAGYFAEDEASVYVVMPITS